MALALLESVVDIDGELARQNLRLDTDYELPQRQGNQQAVT